MNTILLKRLWCLLALSALAGSGRGEELYHPEAVAVDRAGQVYVADGIKNTIRRLGLDGRMTILAGQPGACGEVNGAGSQARFNNPNGLAIDAAGNLYVADSGNNAIRRVTAVGVVTTLPGSATAGLRNPRGVAVDCSGNVYIADRGNNAIKAIAPGGTVRILAGLSGHAGKADGAGSAARFDHPCGVAVDKAGNVYVADRGNNSIRRITPAGMVQTLAGVAGCLGGDDGPGAEARFQFPTSVAVDDTGRVFVADPYNSTIREISPEGVVSTLAGFAGNPGCADGVGENARFNCPSHVALDATGNLYVADTFNNAVRVVTSTGVVTTWGVELARN